MPRRKKKNVILGFLSRVGSGMRKSSSMKPPSRRGGGRKGGGSMPNSWTSGLSNRMPKR